MPAATTTPAPRFLRVTKTMRPHDPGTLKLVRRYGAALICVRYREDGRGQRRCTTIELVIDEGPVQRRIKDRTIVTVRMPWADAELRARALKLGARWDQRAQAWRMSMRVAKALGVERGIGDKSSTMGRHAHVT